MCHGKQLCRFRRRNHQGMLKSVDSRKCLSPKSLETGGSQSINQEIKKSIITSLLFSPFQPPAGGHGQRQDPAGCTEALPTDLHRTGIDWETQGPSLQCLKASEPRAMLPRLPWKLFVSDMVRQELLDLTACPDQIKGSSYQAFIYLTHGSQGKAEFLLLRRNPPPEKLPSALPTLEYCPELIRKGLGKQGAKQST